MSQTAIDEIMRDLADPFPPEAVGWKPQSVKGNRALALAYIDARDVQDRLDAVLGCNNWQNEYQLQSVGNVVCVLSLRLGGEWIRKCDVGGESEQPDGGDRRKASFSDAFKRAAVVWGIGRYLYRIEAKWCDWDAQKREFATPPKLPAWALPRRISAPQAEELHALLSETDSNEAAFLDAVVNGEFGGRPQTVADISVRLHAKALNLVKLKKGRLAQAAALKAVGEKKAAG